jgi:hypothetical protein
MSHIRTKPRSVNCEKMDFVGVSIEQNVENCNGV